MYFWIAVVMVIYVIVKWLLRQPRVGGYGEKYVFITGCDSGFGNSLAKKLDSLGFNVIAGCLTEKGETDLKKACSKKLKSISLDVTSDMSISNAVAEVKKILPSGKGLWAVVNNAGIAGPICPVEWLNKEDFDKTLAVNLWGVIYVTQACLPLLRRENGRLVNMSSIMARFPCVDAPYVISKAGVEVFSDTLRHELYTSGVTIHIIEPGFFGTPLVRFFTSETLRRIFQDRYDKLNSEVKQFYGQEMVEKCTLWEMMLTLSSDFYGTSQNG